MDAYRILHAAVARRAAAGLCPGHERRNRSCRHSSRFVGQHCETVATGSLLGAVGVKLSEPMLFGLGQGLGFIFLNLGSLPLPFTGGRVKPFALTVSLCTNLGLEYTAVETSSRPKAWASLESSLRAGRPVGLQLDCYHLEYFSQPVHFAGHFVAAHGFDDNLVHLVDTASQGSMQTTSRKSLEAARFEKGPMAAKARSWTIAAPKRALTGEHLRKALPKAMRANAADYLSPAFKGASYFGIQKLAASVPQWLQIAKQPERDLGLAALLMEKAGTGGSLFRNFYRDFLGEARDLLGASKNLGRAHDAFAASAKDWGDGGRVDSSRRRKGEAAPLREAAACCGRIADIELDAMRLLAEI